MKLWITTPRIVLPPPVMAMPVPPDVRPESSISRTASSPTASVFGLDPGCVYPFRVTGPVIAGSGVVGVIVWTPVPGMAKAIVSAPMAAFASRIAWRSDPAPLSAVLVTVKVAQRAGVAASARTAQNAWGFMKRRGRSAMRVLLRSGARSRRPVWHAVGGRYCL